LEATIKQAKEVKTQAKKEEREELKEEKPIKHRF
jgi:hypothetical protein